MNRLSLLLTLLLVLTSCSLIPYRGPTTPLRYSGSSTIGLFIADLQARFPRAELAIDVSGESAGGEKAMLEGSTDLAGVARHPSPEVHSAGIASALVGRDAIAVIVHKDLDLDSIKSADLRAVFTGKQTNWQALTGQDLAIQPFIVDRQSATHEVFRKSALEGDDYAGCTVVSPDLDIVERVAKTPGAIGQISFSFLTTDAPIKAVAVDGQAPTVTNFAYPISRPLYLLWRESNAEAQTLVDWAQSPAGQQLIMQRFVGTCVVGVTPTAPTGRKPGFLEVITETFPVDDGGIYYYPHRSYEVFTRHGKLLRRVRNHHSDNDEYPTKIALVPGTYLIRPSSAQGTAKGFFVHVKAGATTRVHAPGHDKDRAP